MGNPFFTCIVVSHNKPVHVAQALASLAGQTFGDWEAIVFDSGVLHDQGYFNDLALSADPRIRLVRSWETDELRNTKTIASWCFNECFRKGLVQGKYITYLCDDDILDPGAFEAFHRYADQHPGTMAMYGTVDMTVITDSGERLFHRESAAKEIKGRCCQGGNLDGHVDYLQLCHHVDVLKIFPNDEYWSEDRDVIRHADGIFLEKIGEHFPIMPVPARIGENRKVPASLNDGGPRLHVLEELCRKADADRRLRKRLGIIGAVLIRCGIADFFRSVKPFSADLPIPADRRGRAQVTSNAGGSRAERA
jgi:glycosyltransferase involved in cell wall biosynthesis